jgi:hypothetical protein
MPAGLTMWVDSQLRVVRCRDKQSHGGETVVMMEGMKRLDRRTCCICKHPAYLICRRFGLGCAILMRDLALDATDGYLLGSTEFEKQSGPFCCPSAGVAECLIIKLHDVRPASTSETPPASAARLAVCSNAAVTVYNI